MKAVSFRPTFLTVEIILHSLWLWKKGEIIYLYEDCVERLNYVYVRLPLAKFVDSLLLRVGTLWRCGDGLIFEVLPLASNALLITLHPLLENVLQIVDHFEISCLGDPLDLDSTKRYSQNAFLH
jgi:hypothetical protein